MTLKKSLTKFKDKILDIIYPDGISCLFCGRDVGDDIICPNCKKQNVFNEGNRCVICDSQIKEGNIICDHCKSNKPRFTTCSCPFVYNQAVRSSILKFKADSAKYLAKYFAKFIFDRLKQDNIEFYVIVPVPSHKKTIKQRGYNPARVLAEELSLLCQKPVLDVLIKTVITKNQKFLNFQERQNNLENSITISDPKTVKGLKVLVIDDVITTGATINICAGLMRKASEIHACAIARRSLSGQN
ncbi:MAG: ComF family protein [Clostridia bacterium]|nr:ComF family protein [Clostridia bacterium]